MSEMQRGLVPTVFSAATKMAGRALAELLPAPLPLSRQRERGGRQAGARASRANSNRPRPGPGPGAGQIAMYAQLCSWDNLLLAYRKAAKGKRGHPNVAGFEYRLEDNLLALQQELKSFSYHPGAYASFYIHEPKRRLISAAPFRDLVIHHALCNLIEPVFERLFIPDTYANRVGKGTHRALDRLQYFCRHYPYALQCDVQQFFPSIDHAILKAELDSHIPDPGALWLVDRILESGVGVLNEVYEMVYFPGDDLFASLLPAACPLAT